MSDNFIDSPKRKKWPHLKNGLKENCPKCGDAPLFLTYLTPVDNCENCGQSWSDIRAELAPAWASMTLSAHIVVPIYHVFIFRSGWPYWMQTLFLMVIATVICLLTLPRMKGLFMGIIWLNRADNTQN